jgi:hypothetical protein
MATVGRTTLDTTGRPVEVSADGKPENKTRGGTIDWSTVAAVAADVTLPDDTLVKTGDKYLRYGQVVTRIGAGEVQTVTLTTVGTPNTAGSFILTLPTAGGLPAEVAAALPYNATAQQMNDALAALTRLGAQGAQVTRTGAGTVADPYVYTIRFNRILGDVPTLTSTHTLNGGTAAVAHATVTAGTGNGKLGPYDSAAGDGRQTLARGEVFIVNQTVVMSQNMSDHPELLEGGRLWKNRVIMTTGAASLAAGPTVATLEPVLPRVSWAE